LIIYYTIDGETYRLDPEDGPLAIVLSPEEKELIASMAPDATVFCSYDEEVTDPEEVSQWVKAIKRKERKK